MPEKVNEDMHGEKAGWRGKEMAEKPEIAGDGLASALEFGVSEMKRYEKYGGEISNANGFHGRSGGDNEAGEGQGKRMESGRRKEWSPAVRRWSA